MPSQLQMDQEEKNELLAIFQNLIVHSRHNDFDRHGETVFCAGGDEILRFKAFDGKPFYQLQWTATKQKMDVLGQAFDQRQRQEFVILWTPPKKDTNGNYVVSQKFVGIKMDLAIGGNKIKYDSTGSSPGALDGLEKMMQCELFYTISPALEVLSVEGRGNCQDLPDMNPQLAGMLRTMQVQQENTIEATIWAFPDGGKVSKDLMWRREFKLDLGPIGANCMS